MLAITLALRVVGYAMESIMRSIMRPLYAAALCGRSMGYVSIMDSIMDRVGL